MKRSIKMLAVLTAIVGFVSVQTVLADELVVEGEIIEVDRSLSTIVIKDDATGELIAIQGFPFRNLEIQLDEILDPLNPDEDGITIDVGDCVTLVYWEKELRSGDVVNKWESLILYCEECTEICYEEEDGMIRNPQKNRNQGKPKAGPWQGTPPGHRR